MPRRDPIITGYQQSSHMQRVGDSLIVFLDNTTKKDQIEMETSVITSGASSADSKNI